MNYSNFGETLNTGDEAVYAVFGIMMIILLVVLLFAIIFKVITRWVFFNKCGEEGWKALIPIYTDYTLIKIAGLNWWWILIIFAGTIFSCMQSTFNVLEKYDTASSLTGIAIIISFLNILSSFAALFARINQSYNISKKFNKSGGYTVLLVLFEPIMLLVLGLSKNDKYDATVEVSPNGLIGAQPTKTTVYCPDCGSAVQEDFCPKCGKKVR